MDGLIKMAAKGSKLKKLKCWKKTQDTKQLTTFEHVCRRYNGELVQVYKSESHSPPWRTTHNSGGKFVEDKLSESKAKALEHAYKYMKDADVCW